MRLLPAAAASLAASLAAAPTALAAQEADPAALVCGSCHADAGVEREAALVHADSVTCLTCHHIGYTNDRALAARRRLEACTACHAAQANAASHPMNGDAAPTCTACHVIHRPEPATYGRGLPDGATFAAACRRCHDEAHSLHAGASRPPDCAACHRLHPTGPDPGGEGAAAACSTCHESPHPTHAGLGDDAPACATCHTVVEGAAPASDARLLEAECARCHAPAAGLHAADVTGSPACLDCHAVASDPPLVDAGAQISWRCGACHVEALAEVRAGGHAAGLDEALRDPALPTCVTCHTAHGEGALGGGPARLAVTPTCVACHADEERIRTYALPRHLADTWEDDVHGATLRFLLAAPDTAGGPDVLVCSDCHGPHGVGPSAADTLGAVCLECHEGAGASFARAWLGHDPPTPRHQALIWLVRAFYYVLIPFVLGGLALNILFHLMHERRKGARVREAAGVLRLQARLRAWRSGRRPAAEPSVTRFSLLERGEHLAAMITFFLLVVTGVPQTAPGSAAGRWIIGLCGGIRTTRLVHRAVGFAFVALLVVHVARGVAGIVARRRLPAITPERRDFTDLVKVVRHYVRGEPQPKADRFDASEKFEYWGLILGGTLMSVTGVVLVFPELASWILPGTVVAAMRVMHGLEATFAVLVIVLWHSYGVILRPEVFPLDTAMFTGRISVERLRTEHALEYERLFGSPTAVEPPPDVLSPPGSSPSG